MQELAFIDLDRLDYASALSRQRALHERVLAGDAPPTVLLVEHDPVITISQRRGAGANVLVDAARLATLGIDAQPTDRGGDVTYHGPGQLVAYPIVRLADLRFSIGRYIRFLESVIIDAVATFGVAARRVEGCTGVWVGGGAAAQALSCAAGGGAMRRPGAAAKPAAAAKLAAIGVRVKRNVTLHGLALNVTTNLDHFQTIIPCGLTNRNVASLQSILGDTCPTMEQVKHAMMQTFRVHYAAAQNHASTTK